MIRILNPSRVLPTVRRLRWRIRDRPGHTSTENEEWKWRKTWGQPQLQTRVHDYVIQHCRVPQVLRELQKVTMEYQNSNMATTIDQLPILAMFVRLVKAKYVVDIGTFTGISALQLALALPHDGRVITIDKRDEHLPLAKEYWERAEVSHKIEARIGNGLDVLDDLVNQGHGSKIDLSFIDANKLGSEDYYEKLFELVHPGGVMIFDNMLWYGRVADEEVSDNITISTRKLNKKLLEDDRIAFTLLPAADGMVICEVL